MKEKKTNIFFQLLEKTHIEELGFSEKHLLAGFVGMLFIFILIGNRYSCMAKINRIDKLQQELQKIRIESISVSNELTRNSKRSQIETAVEKQDLGLKIADKPAFLLHKE